MHALRQRLTHFAREECNNAIALGDLVANGGQFAPNDCYGAHFNGDGCNNFNNNGWKNNGQSSWCVHLI